LTGYSCDRVSSKVSETCQFQITFNHQKFVEVAELNGKIISQYGPNGPVLITDLTIRSFNPGLAPKTQLQSIDTQTIDEIKL
jgi:hypothetical protein